MKDLQTLLSKATQAIVTALQRNNALMDIAIARSDIGESAALAMAKLLQDNRRLMVLDVSNNNIPVVGIQAIAMALQENRTLTTVAMDGNQIGDSGAQSIAEALKTDNVLTMLSVGYQTISSIGVKYLADAMTSNATLTSLYVEGNMMLHGAVRSLFAQAMQLSSGLDSLEVPPFEEEAQDWALLSRRLQEHRDAEAYVNAGTHALWTIEGASSQPEVVLPPELNNLLAQHLVALGDPGVETIKDLSAMARVLGRRDEDDKA